MLSLPLVHCRLFSVCGRRFSSTTCTFIFLFFYFLFSIGIAGAQELGDGQPAIVPNDVVLDEIEALINQRNILEQQENELAETLKQQADRLTQQRDAMDEQARLIQQQKASLDAQRRKIESLRLQMDELATMPLIPDPEDGEKPAESTSADQDGSGEQGKVSGPVGQAPSTTQVRPRQAVDVIEEQAVLTHKGTLIVEPSLHYSYSSVTRVALEGFTIIPAITIGSIDVKEVDRNTIITALSMRLGVTNRFEAGLKIPYVHRRDTTVSRPLAVVAEADTLSKADGADLGDVELLLNYMFNKAKGSGPYYVGSLRLKSRSGSDPFEVDVDPETGLQTSLPSGSGFWSVQPGVSISFPSDPAVFYGSLSYLNNIERKVNSVIGRIDPGDAVGFSFGMAFALNQKASFSLAYSHSSVAATKQNGDTLPGSDRLQVGALLLGLSHRVGKQRNLSISLGAGLTEDAPDVQVSFRLPIAFDLGSN